ncbi:hypothetical protein [Dongia deserti]|uniref:hypothetical protein n=1 Tax=Dongia deserti TaxID=2268030 RepID=UPI000E64B84B|nr:hypothetical protein [Dongia deserti]
MAKAPEAMENAGEALAVVPSDLDDKTHAEMLMLYTECANSVRFAKSQQWTTTGGALAIFVILGVLGEFGPHYGFLTQTIIVVSMIVSGASIYSLAIYQFWQQAERGKLTMISERFSNVLRDVRAYLPPREANVHRYILLVFMLALILIANWLLILYLKPYIRFNP